MAPRLHLIFLLMIHWVSSANWGVNYSPLHICALENSSVIISCNYKYPTGHQVTNVFWTKELKKQGVEPPDLSEDPEYSQRLQYLGDQQQNCTVRLSHVTKKDEHQYYFRFITNVTTGKWTGVPGVSLYVADLQVESPERVTEGDSVRLTCKSSCNLTDTPTFIWYRNSQPLNESGDKSGRIFTISKINSDDSGEYNCRAINEHGEKYSESVNINVMYPPRHVSVSISGSAVIVSGDSVTLTCSSDSNPPALNFSWFKEETFVGSGRIFNISKISSDESGEYKCRARNKYGEKYSESVNINVMYPPRRVSVSISGSAVIVSGDSVTLSCSSDSNPPALNFSWLKEETFVGSGRIFNISKISSDESGEYKCRARNEHGVKDSESVNINVMYPPRNVSVSISGSGDIVSGGSVSLSCSSDSNPPALNFSWFKENQSSSVGSGQSFSAVESGRFYCEAHNPHGSQRSDAVTVTVNRGMSMIVITVASGGLFIIIILIIILFVIKKRRSVQSEGLTVTQNTLCSDGPRRVSVDDEPLSEPDSASDAQYASVKPRRGRTPESRDPEEVQYATVQYHRNTQMKTPEENQYDNIRVQQPGEDHRRSDVETVDVTIYSSIR